MGKRTKVAASPIGEHLEARSSSPTWETLRDWLRGKIRELMQGLLEEEVTEFLGRARYERRAAVDACGYRNGYGKPRKLTTSMGTIEVRRPRVRGVEERFESRILPLFARRTREVSELLPELYLHGLAEGDFDLALRGLLGEEAALSARTVARLKERWQAEWEAWRTQRLDDRAVVYLWVDGVYVKAGLERERAALLVAIAALSDGRKVVVAVVPGYRESVESWSEVLRDLRERGMNAPRLVIGDGNLGIWGALRNVWPEADEQRCWNHKVLNVLEQLPRHQQAVAKPMLGAIAYAPTRAEAERKGKEFEAWCHRHGYGKAAQTLGRDWERMVTFYRYPKEHWRHLRTTNVIESPFAALRLRTDAAKRFKKVERATAVIWKMLMVAQKRFRRLNAPELLAKVHAGVRYEDGIEVTQEEVAA
ncbi:MAG: IS256 family transposase [Deinococcota bacterium]